MNKSFLSPFSSFHKHLLGVYCIQLLHLIALTFFSKLCLNIFSNTDVIALTILHLQEVLILILFQNKNFTFMKCIFMSHLSTCRHGMAYDLY